MCVYVVSVYLPNPFTLSQRAGWGIKSIFSGVQLGLNSDFSFSKFGYRTKVK